MDSLKTGKRYNYDLLSIERLINSNIKYDYIVIASTYFQDKISDILKQKNITNFRTLSPIFNSNPLDAVPESQNILYAFYDRAVSPDGFDIANFLYLADIERERLGCKYLHPVFIPQPQDFFLQTGESIAYDNIKLAPAKEEKDIRWCERNIQIPCCWLLPSCNQVTVCTSRAEAAQIKQYIAINTFPQGYEVSSPIAAYAWRLVVEAVKTTSHLPSFRAAPQALDYVSTWIDANAKDKKIVTITLRESSSQADRNSNIDEWLQFASKLENSIYCPVILRDTNVALSELHEEYSDFLIFKEAPWNLELRMAIYELAYLNMFNNNGPAVLSLFNKKTRFIMFNTLRKNEYFECSEKFIIEEGLPVGSQFPGATKYQVTVWNESNATTMFSEFELLCSLIEKKDCNCSDTPHL